MIIRAPDFIYEYCTRHNLDVVPKLEQYVKVLLSWNKKINLIGKSTEQNIWMRHILDCLQLIQYIKPGATVADLGSGAGLPGVVLAITRLYNNTILVEKLSKKCTFLDHVVSTLQIEDVCKISNNNIQNLNLNVDYIVSRATFDTEQFLTLPDTIKAKYILLLKGTDIVSHIRILNKYNAKHEMFGSITNAKSVIIRIENYKLQ